MKITFNFLDGDIQTFSTSKAKIIIGRSPRADIVVTQEGFSRQHCQIELVNGEIFITDLDSANGVFIDGKKIEPNEQISYNAFLPMSFGPTKNIEIDAESSTSVGMAIALEIESTGSRSRSNSKKASSRKASSERKDNTPGKGKTNQDTKSHILNILIVVALVAFGAYYMMNQEKSPETELGGKPSKASPPASQKNNTIDF